MRPKVRNRLQVRRPEGLLKHISLGILAPALLVTMCGRAEARPHVRESYPAAEMILDGRNAQYIIRFDGWVDHAASRLDIIANGKIVETLVPTGTASLMPWPPLPLCWHQSVTTFIGVRSLCPTVIYQKG